MVEKLFKIKTTRRTLYYKDEACIIEHHPTKPSMVLVDGRFEYYLDDLFHNINGSAANGLRYITRDITTINEGRIWGIQDYCYLFHEN